MKYKNFQFPGDMQLFGWVFVWLVWYSFLLKIQPAPRILHSIRCLSAKPSKFCDRYSSLDKIWRIATFILVNICRDSKPCLRRSLVLYRWCRRHRIDGEVAIGVWRGDEGLQGHAWLMIQGDVYRENAGDLEKFTVMLKG